jgi:hypothetical protein
VRCNSRRPEYGLPIRAETPEGALETGHALARGADLAPRSGTGRHVAAWNGSSSGGRHGDRRRKTPGGARGAERCPGDRKGNPLKGEPQERRRYETRPAGSRGERGVKRLRKPEDAAQPGQASPVSVAPRHLKRCRGEGPQESVSVPIRRLVRRVTADGPGSGQTLEQSEAHERILRRFIVGADLGPAERPRRPTPRGAKVREGSSTHGAIPRALARL